MKEIRPALVAWETGSDTSQCEYEKIPAKPADPEKFEDYIAKKNPLIPAKRE